MVQQPSKPLPIVSGPGEVRRVPLRLHAPGAAIPPGGAEVTLVVEAFGAAPTVIQRGTRFIGPADPGGGLR